MAVSEFVIRGFKGIREDGRRFLAAPGPEGVLNRGFVLIAAVTLVTAWFSETYFFPDEHYQILEFMAMKLGITSSSSLPWEYGAKARPFTQPFLYYLIAKPLIALGLRNRRLSD